MPIDLSRLKVTRQPQDAAESEALVRCLQDKTSFLAENLLGEKRKLTVCQSGAGYYLGCADEEGPVARDSGYYPTSKAAQTALDNYSWEQRLDA